MNALSNASIQDEYCEGLASFVLPETKSSQTGVSVRHVPHEGKMESLQSIGVART